MTFNKIILNKLGIYTLLISNYVLLKHIIRLYIIFIIKTLIIFA